jgi:tRNA(fMet)-specific endonuclease VapC
MNGDFLLDTNMVIALLASDRAILKRKKRAEKFFIPSIVVGELFYGAYHSAHAQKNIAQVEVFAAANAVLNCDTETGRYYGEIKNRLRKVGRPIPENDIWIAALARQYELTLISRDKHFREVANLQIEVW